VTGAGGLVYVAADRLYAFSASCGSVGAACEPLWTARVPGAKTAFLPAPAVGGGLVFVSSDRLRAFPASCGADESCHPLWTSPALGPGHELFSAALTERSAYVLSADGRLYAFTVPAG
jgi:hypothetical protein